MNTGLATPRRHLLVIPGKVVVGMLVMALVVSVAAVFRTRFVNSSATVAYTTTAVTRGTVTSGVTATGPISAAAAVPLNFKQSGKLTAIKVSIGDSVIAGQALATLDTADFEASLQQAQASLASSQAAYNKLAQQPLPTDVNAAAAAVNVAGTQLATAQHSLTTAQASAAQDVAAAQQTVANAQQGVADAQRNAATVPAVVAQQIQQAKDKLYADQISYDAQVGRGQASKESRQAALNADETAITQAQASAEQTLSQSQQALSQAQQTLKTAQANLTSTQAKAGQTVQAAQDQLASAQSSLAESQANYEKAAAPATQADFDAAKAQVSNAQAAVKLAQNNLDSATLLAPSGGTVTAINGAVGQWITGGATSGAAASSASGASTTSTQTTMISLTSLSGLQITAQVNEADISKVKVGQAVKFAVDAFAGRTFSGKVAAIQPLGTTSSNVVTYSVLINTDQTDVQLLPGMTASATIVTGEAQDALRVPVSAMTYARTNADAQAGTSGQSGTHTLYALKAGKPAPVQVKLGLSDGKFYEVVSGLNEGDQVVTAGGAGSSSSQGGPRGPGGFLF